MGCSKQGLLRRERFENRRNYFDRSFKNVVEGGGNIFFCSTFFFRLAYFFYFCVWQIKIFCENCRFCEPSGGKNDKNDKNDKNEIKKQVRGRLHLEVPKFFKNDS